jgi:hypothetical protein
MGVSFMSKSASDVIRDAVERVPTGFLVVRVRKDLAVWLTDFVRDGTDIPEGLTNQMALELGLEAFLEKFKEECERPLGKSNVGGRTSP